MSGTPSSYCLRIWPTTGSLTGLQGLISTSPWAVLDRFDIDPDAVNTSGEDLRKALQEWGSQYRWR